MKDLLQQASRALSVHDADALERLAAEAARSGPSACLDGVEGPLSVLRQQVAAAQSHMQLGRTRYAMTSTQERPWVR